MWQCQRSSTRGLATLGLATVIVVAGCATQQAANKGEQALEHRNWDAAVYHYLEALAREPENVEYRMSLIRARQNASQQHFKRGTTLRELGQLTAARDELRLAVQLDPTHQFARQELKQLEYELEVLSRPNGVEELEEIKRRAREAKVQPPILDPTSDEPITLNFPRPTPVKEIYQAMAKAYGFNVLFDPKLKDDKLSIELRDVTAQDALEIVMRAAGHFYKVHDERTIIIAEDTPQMRREYEDLVIKTFFLSNADVKEVDKLLRSLIEARRLSTNEQLNAITLRDTADKVAIAERLITTKAKAEVLVDVELLQINTSSESNIGMNLSTYSYALSLDPAQVQGTTEGGGGVFLPDLGNVFNDDFWFIAPIPDVIINLVKSSGEAQTLAQPQLRISEGEKGSLVIGDSVPIPVTSFNTSNTVGGSVVPITSFQYRDVGIKIDVEPRVHHNREVTLKLSVEVSQLGEEVSVGPSQSAVAIGTRNITSVIRLEDGETSLMAGLLRVDESDSRSETPGLSSIPLLGRLFTNKNRTKRTTDLVLTLTPHIIRFPDIAEEDLAPVWVGTESRISYFGSSSPQVASGRAATGPFDTSRVEGMQEEDPNAFGVRRTSPGGPTGRPLVQPPVEEPGTGAFDRRQIPRPQVPQPQAPQPGDDDGKAMELVPGDAANPAGQDGGSARVGRYGWPSDGADLVSGVDPTAQLVRVSLEPSVVSLGPGEETLLQVLVSGGDGDLRLPLSVSFDTRRVEVVDVLAAAGVGLTDDDSRPAEGWLAMELALPASGAVPQVAAAIRVRGIAEGPSPMVVAADPAVGEDGSQLPVAADDGAVYVLAPSGGQVR